MTAERRVAVVIPCYQYANFLAGAIESVLDQSIPAAEILVVDDGSNDRPEAVVDRYPNVRLISQPRVWRIIIRQQINTNPAATSPIHNSAAMRNCVSI